MDKKSDLEKLSGLDVITQEEVLALLVKINRIPYLMGQGQYLNLLRYGNDKNNDKNAFEDYNAFLLNQKSMLELILSIRPPLI